MKKRRIDESQKQNTLIEALDSEPKLKIPYSITEILNTSELNQTSRMIYVRSLKNFILICENLMAFMIIFINFLECYAKAFIPC